MNKHSTLAGILAILFLLGALLENTLVLKGAAASCFSVFAATYFICNTLEQRLPLR